MRRPIPIPETDACFQTRVKLEKERQALAAFVSKFDALEFGGLGLPPIPVSSSTSTPFNPPKPTPGGANAIFPERQKNRLVVGSLGSPKIAETNEPGANVAESPLRVPKAKVENQPSLLEQWEGVSMHVEDFKPETVIGNALTKEKGDRFRRRLGLR